MLVAVRAGSAHDPADRLGLAHFVSKVIDRGTETRSGDAIAEALDGRGVTLNSSVGRHLLTLGCTCLAEDFDDMIGLVADVVRRPTFPQAEVDTRRGEIVTAIRQDEDSPATHGGRRADGAAVSRWAPLRPANQRRRRDGGSDYARGPGGLPPGAVLARTSHGGYRRRRVRGPRGIAAAERVFGDWHTPRSAAARASAARPRRRSPASGHPDDEQGAGGRGVRVRHGHTARSGLLRAHVDEQCPRAVRAGRAARRQHPRAAGDGVLRLQQLRRQRGRRTARHPRGRSAGKCGSHGGLNRRGGPDDGPRRA